MARRQPTRSRSLWRFRAIARCITTSCRGSCRRRGWRGSRTSRSRSSATKGRRRRRRPRRRPMAEPARPRSTTTQRMRQVRDDASFTRNLRYEIAGAEGRAMLGASTISIILGILWIALVIFGPQTQVDRLLPPDEAPIEVTVQPPPPPEEPVKTETAPAAPVVAAPKAAKAPDAAAAARKAAKQQAQIAGAFGAAAPGPPDAPG